MWDEIPDIHSEKPSVELGVDRVGLLKLRAPPMRVEDYTVLPVFKAFVNLPGYARGAHLSRIYEAYVRVVKPHGELSLDLLRTLAEELLRVNDYSDTALVSMRGRLYYTVARGNVPEYSGNGFIYAGLTFKRGVGSLREYSGGGVYGLSTCPCAKAVARHLYGEPYTHMQKVRIDALLESRRLRVEPVEVFKRLSGIVHVPRNHLKRIDEASFVREVYEDSSFTEDIARRASLELARLAASRGDTGLDGVLYVRVRSYETIHEYVVESVVKAGVSELLGVVK
ncbi:GTP cyclohydrolase, FolE2/MptA family [Desulfurococcus mucosus]|uniref:GTP cyclohydrolase IV n=1 Tax=Desulfurococcus mucosus (strain ATCC 35584 / DSM 2162 / JCM 9187 / O7/1) TaxID=765177 RepID=E8R9F4_DESM0|nr:GTP cyclohydrolase, FolE2/MptA family [Desulfurococcus mucosus]ADV65130.1 protein of unknown function DUF198 [Desulfurococcus mucosus DSM 2162]